ncbi:hypothetical protein LVJ83_04910 [Uruburuella testudinis]|uniref:Uncharacterized protein n=1 Tax=Uruburuella testudinis TaxID=1282863 RepID=A0ABY4DVE5_9NEIS|nr:hypothetical protein [Uruburuella testudinis]UOO82808.1 hypothetical protein LVJ83_04910 [Uruburuella testudinis]
MGFIRCLLGIHHFDIVEKQRVFPNETDSRALYSIFVQRCRCCGKIRQTRIGTGRLKA